MTARAILGYILVGVGLTLSAQIALDAYRQKRGPFDALVNDQHYCAAAKIQVGKRIILDGAELGPCTTKDIGRKP